MKKNVFFFSVSFLYRHIQCHGYEYAQFNSNNSNGSDGDDYGDDDDDDDGDYHRKSSMLFLCEW